MKNLSNYFLGFVTFVFAVVVISLTCYLTIPNFKNFVDNLINPPKTEAYNLVISAENASVKVMQGESEIEPGEKVLTAGSVYTITVGSISEDFHCTYFYLNGVLYANGSEVVCESDFDISALVVGTYDLTISYVNCEGLEVLDITNPPALQPGVSFEGLVVTPGEKVLYKDQKLRFNVPRYTDKEFTELKIIAGTNTLIYTYEDLATTTTYSVYADTHIELTYTDIVEEPVALPASYFTFNDGALMGFSAEGQVKYDAGEITELVLPATYGVGEVSTQELRFREFFELDIYCMENGYNFTFVDSSGDIISVTSEEDFHSVEMLIEEVIMTNYSITITAEVPTFIDSKEFVVTEIHPTAFVECTNLVSATLPSTLAKYNYSTFDLCSNLKSINISEKNSVFKSVNGVLYSKDGSILYTAPGGIESFVVPNTVVEIGDCAFEFREKLTNLDFEPNSRLEKIGDSAFNHTSLDMDTLIIPRSVKFIGSYAFSSLTSSSVIFESGSALEYLGQRAFAHSSSLVKFVFPAVESISLFWVFMSNTACLLYDFSAVGSVPVIDDGEFLEINDNCKIVVPDELYDSWIVAENWTTFADYIVKASEYTPST